MNRAVEIATPARGIGVTHDAAVDMHVGIVIGIGQSGSSRSRITAGIGRNTGSAGCAATGDELVVRLGSRIVSVKVEGVSAPPRWNAYGVQADESIVGGKQHGGNRKANWPVPFELKLRRRTGAGHQQSTRGIFNDLPTCRRRIGRQSGDIAAFRHRLQVCGSGLAKLEWVRFSIVQGDEQWSEVDRVGGIGHLHRNLTLRAGIIGQHGCGG